TKASKKFRDWSLKRVLTTCPHCATGCQMNLLVKNNKVVGVEPVNGPSNKGLLCVKGRFAYNFINHPDRLKYPLIKKNGVFERATWDEALDLIASKLKGIRDQYGPDAIAGFSCSRTVNEDNYVFQKMMRAGIGTNNVDQCARLCHSATVHGLAMTLGSGAMTNTITDITHTDVILLIGSNTTEAHPVIGTQIRQAAMRGTKIIVIDPRRIDLCDQAKIHLQIKPGTNIAILNAMMNYILSEGLEDKEYIANKTEGFEEFREILKDYKPEDIAKLCHVDAEDIKEAARLYATADKASIIYCLGVTEHSQGTEGVMSTSNLALMCGKIGREGCGVNPLRGQNNVQGACDMGCMPGEFPGYQKVANPDVLKKFEKAWGTKLNPKPGLMMTDVIPAAIKGDIKALYIMGEDPVVTDPDTNHLLKAINNLEFFAIQEIFMTETAKLADVVLPAVCYAEKEGTFSNTERRVQRVRKAVEPEGECKQDYEILCEIMTRMGYECHYDSAADIMDEIASLTPSFGGISHKRLDTGESIQWPCTSADHPGTPIMHVGKFSRGERALFYPAAYMPSKELPDDEYPFTLMTGRMLYHYNTRAMTGKTEGINKIAPSSYIELNPEDAARLGVADGDKVRVYSRRGELYTSARITDKVSPRETFMTFHFPDGNANWVTIAATDNIAKIPDYKVCAINIEKA
ncbi:MAG: formate dehydrogenase subunit alpha, partial [Lachnospiraceae bacterium]|nr:formate dehydrogenase subunit alpha [Lachnospiraceae bacterium]